MRGNRAVLLFVLRDRNLEEFGERFGVRGSGDNIGVGSLRLAFGIRLPHDNKKLKLIEPNSEIVSVAAFLGARLFAHIAGRVMHRTHNESICLAVVRLPKNQGFMACSRADVTARENLL